ncbi:Phospholipase D [Pseudocercospora fuligena]|uniref:Phospholipase n=1 Tax=Pseudocercospora fuligena TaxID=685502 RepID=A0A8H6RNF7_9PEZI|nr:Phospholipase D [Pseudocercospora fuligena]
MVGKTSDVGSPEEQKKHLDGENHEKGGTFAKLREKLKDTKLHDAKVSAIHLKHRLGKFQNLVNTNHRHDEEHEQKTDAKRTKIAEGHRFQSFAPERDGNMIKWYIDGRDYFHAVSVALERAKETIYIEDWWLSPELFLRRPPYHNQEWRLDNVLKRAAERGVKIYVIVYREVQHALTCNSEHTKKALMALCPEGSPGHGNIRLMRHPDHNVLENASDMTFYWAHHEKFIVIDYDLAFIGGLDLCFGRWDNRQHVLADAHPAGVQNEMFPGQDFNNNRIMDFQSVQDWKSNEVSKADYGRMPWHDVAMGVIGPCIYDIAEHFVLRWNFCKRDKYKRDDRYDWLTLTGRTGEDEDLIGVQRPKHPVGDYIHHPLSPLQNKRGNPRQGKTRQHPHTEGGAEQQPIADDESEEFHDAQEEVDEHGYTKNQHGFGHGLEKQLREHGIHRPHRGGEQEAVEDNLKPQHQENAKVTGNDPKKEGTITASGGMAEKRKGYGPSDKVDHGIVTSQGTVHAQLVRSSADWSSGILAEQSIQNAYCQVIREAKHYVYIENQFFITATGPNQAPIHNQIGGAIADAIISAAKENRKFRVIIVIPAIPGFAGDLRDNAAAGTRAIMDYQYKSICRGDESIFGKVKAAGIDPTQYMYCFNLRSYDRLNKTPKLKEQEQKSGVTYQEVQRAQAEEIMPEGIHASESLEGSANAGARQTAKEGGVKGLFNKGRRTSLDIDEKDKVHPEDDNDDATILADKKRRFEEHQHENLDDHVKSQDSIAQDAMLGQKKPSEEAYAGRTKDGKKDGDDEKSEDARQQELENFVQEELYIHGKLLVVDDRIAICGSSNINDRSQIGFHDSELSIVMEDTLPLQSKMNGEEYRAGHHAATLRRMLWREHLGLLPPQSLDAENDVNAQPPGDGENDWCNGDEWDKFVEDPLSDELWDMWTKNANVNTKVFRHIFHADPDDNVKTFEEYDKFLGSKGSRKAGHVFDEFQPVEVVRQELDKIRGHLVWMPLRFLEDAELAERGLQVNSITESVYT